MEQRSELLRRLDALKGIRDADRDPAYPVGSPRNPAVDLIAIEEEIEELVTRLREMPRPLRRSAPNRDLLHNMQLWTRIDFKVQLGFSIGEDEVDDLPLATVDVDGKPAIPEMDGSQVVTRRVTMSFPPHRALKLAEYNASTATLHGAFLLAVKQARKEGSTESFVNLGAKGMKTSLIENAQPTAVNHAS